MHKDAIADLISERNNNLISWLEHQDSEKWETGPISKWTTGQQAMHLLQSVKPLNTALSLPRFIIKTRFGTSNREVRDYNKVVERYRYRLANANGTVYKPSQNMKPVNIKDKRYILDRLQMEHKKLEYKTRKISDENLDFLVLPHPLMGKMPVREMLMWTAYHIEHHSNQLKDNY